MRQIHVYALLGCVSAYGFLEKQASLEPESVNVQIDTVTTPDSTLTESTSFTSKDSVVVVDIDANGAATEAKNDQNTDFPVSMPGDLEVTYGQPTAVHERDLVQGEKNDDGSIWIFDGPELKCVTDSMSVCLPGPPLANGKKACYAHELHYILAPPTNSGGGCDRAQGQLVRRSETCHSTRCKDGETLHTDRYCQGGFTEAACEIHTDGQCTLFKTYHIHVPADTLGEACPYQEGFKMPFGQCLPTACDEKLKADGLKNRV